MNSARREGARIAAVLAASVAVLTAGLTPQLRADAAVFVFVSFALVIFAGLLATRGRRSAARVRRPASRSRPK